MNPMKMKEISRRHQPVTHKGRNAVMAGIGGGSLACLGQWAINRLTGIYSPSDAATLVMLGIILIAALLTGFGIYDKLAQIFGGGLFVPISGFANALASSAMECRSEGFIFGIGSNMFKLAGSVITYGIVSALIFSTLRYGWMLL